MLSDIYTALDSGDIAALALLDLSAAFDTVDHRILLQRLQKSFGLSSSALAWLTSYLSRRQCLTEATTLRRRPFSLVCRRAAC